MAFSFKHLTATEREEIRAFETAIKEFREKRSAILRMARQRLQRSDRNLAIVRRLDAGETVATLRDEFGLSRARIYELAGKARRAAAQADPRAGSSGKSDMILSILGPDETGQPPPSRLSSES
jgi:hypothetical protein